MSGLAILALAARVATAIVTFPGTQREVSSPDSAFTVIWWEPDPGKTEHSLLLKGAGNPKSWRVYSFPRSVSVSWALAQPILIVTDRSSSDGATTFAQNASTGRKWHVCADPQQRLGVQWSAAHHRYCEQAGWTKRGELRLRLWGYGEGVAFDTTATVPVRPE